MTLKLLPLLMVAALSAAPLSAQTTVLFGDLNNTPGDAADAATPAADFASWMGVVTDFDHNLGYHFGTTMALPTVSSAKVHIRLTAMDALANTAYLYFRFQGGAETFAYGAQLAFLRNATQGIPTLSTGEVIDFEFNLGQLPSQTDQGSFFSVLGGMNLDGNLEVYLSNSVSVDFIEVTYFDSVAPSLTVQGSLPGESDLVMTDLTPGANVYLAWGLSLGSFTATILEGLVDLDLIPVAGFYVGQASPEGTAIFPITLPPAILGMDIYVQAVDGETLTAGQVLTL